MDTKEMSREQISALADGELLDAHVNVTLAVLRQPEEQTTWNLYHQIGDILCFGDKAFSLSSSFTARMRACLDTEPALLVPQSKTPIEQRIAVPAIAASGMSARERFARRFSIPGTAFAVAVAAVVFVAAQQPAMMAKDGAATPAAMALSGTTVAVTSASRDAVRASSLTQQGDIIRDPRIDDYLLAHQRFSPSMYSSVQYARSVAFTVDSDE
ncbi:MAG: RseA family anti-sigma factor [Herbaspirillum sp.]